MTNLTCRALHCVNNHSRLCCRREIQVGGQGAAHPQETRCDSYVRESEGYSNRLDSREAEEATRIDCEARRCVYNAGGLCGAGDVTMDGGAALRPDGTSCETFLAQD